MTDYENAESLVGAHLAKWSDDLVVTDIAEYEFGWVFCYNSKAFLKTGDLSFAIAGNAPLIVDKRDGLLYVTGTENELDYYIQQYRAGVRTRA